MKGEHNYAPKLEIMDLKTKLERSLDNNWLETIRLSSGDGSIDFALPPYHPRDTAKVKGAKNAILKAINAGVSGLIPQDTKLTSSRLGAGHLRMRHAMTETIPILVNDTLIYQIHAKANTERHGVSEGRRVRTSEWAYFNRPKVNGRHATINDLEPLTQEDYVEGSAVYPTPETIPDESEASEDTDEQRDWETEHTRSQRESEMQLRSLQRNYEYNWSNGYVVETTTPGIARIAFLERTGYRMERINGRDDAEALFVVRCTFDIRTLKPEHLHWVPDPISGSTDITSGNLERNVFLPIAHAMAAHGPDSPLGEFDNQRLDQFLEELRRKEGCLIYMEQLKRRLIEITEVTDTIESCVVMNRRFAEIFSRLNYQTQGGRLQSSGYNSLKCGLYKDVSAQGALRNLVSDPENVGSNPLLVRCYNTRSLSLGWEYGNPRTTNNAFNWARMGVAQLPRPYTRALNPYNGYRILIHPSAGRSRRTYHGMAAQIRQMPLSTHELSDGDKYQPIYRYFDTLGNWEYNYFCARRGIAYVRELVKPSLMTQLLWYAQNTTTGAMPIQTPLFVKNHGFGDGGPDGADEYYIKLHGIGENRRRPTFSESIAAMGVTQVLTHGTESRPFSVLRDKALQIHNGAYTGELDDILARCPEVEWEFDNAESVTNVGDGRGYQPVPWMPHGFPTLCLWWRKIGDGEVSGLRPKTLRGLLIRDDMGYVLNIPTDLQIRYQAYNGTVGIINSAAEGPQSRIIPSGRYRLIVPRCETLDEYHTHIANALRAEIIWETMRIGTLVDDWRDTIDVEVATSARTLTSAGDETDETIIPFIDIMMGSRLNVAEEE